MDYAIRMDRPVSAEIKRIVRSLSQDGIDHIDGDLDDHETVHEVRKRCKEARAAARLVRPVLPTYSEENVHFRDTARIVSDIRDATALIETFDDHVRPAVEDAGALSDDELNEIRETIVAPGDERAEAMDLEGTLATVRERLEEGIERADELPIATDGFDAVAGGLRKSYKRAYNRMEDAYDDPTTEAFHEWRKRLKYHRYHTYMLRNAWFDPMKARRSELKELSDITGDEHDLAVFVETLDEEELFDNDVREALNDVIAARRGDLRRRARPLGERLFEEDPDALVDRFEGYWTAARRYDLPA